MSKQTQTPIMTEMPREVLEAIVAASNASSKDCTRYNLTGVHLVISADGYYIEATDGRILSTRNVAKSDGCEALAGEWNITADLIKPLKALLKDYKRCNTVMVERDKDTLTFKSMDQLQRYACKQCEAGFYPDTGMYSKGINEPREATIILSPDYLYRLFMALRDGSIKSKDCGITLYIKDSKSPVVVECQGAKGLIMPRRAA